MTTPQFVIYGSCVGRDTFTELENDGFKLGSYIARQSIISAANDASDIDLDVSLLSSKFQQRMVLGDLSGNAISLISSTFESDPNAILLWDLADERTGVFRSPQGQIITRSTDAHSNGVFNRIPETWEKETFGSLAHRMAFMEASAKFRDTLISLNAWKRTYILAVPWAERSIQGSDTPTSYGFTAAHANEVYAEYYEFLKFDGWNLIEPSKVPLADENHRWGLAPFHYEKNVYIQLAQTIQELAVGDLRT